FLNANDSRLVASGGLARQLNVTRCLRQCFAFLGSNGGLKHSLNKLCDVTHSTRKQDESRREDEHSSADYHELKIIILTRNTTEYEYTVSKMVEERYETKKQ
ncbi:hypothetical protein BDZ89DRAFT_1079201, partial [Hymenopellis radicata]